MSVDPNNLTVDDFITMAGGFPAEVAQNPYPVTAILSPYSELPKVVGPPDPFETEEAEQLISQFAATYRGIRRPLGDLNYMQAHLDEFVFPLWTPSSSRQ